MSVVVDRLHLDTAVHRPPANGAVRPLLQCVGELAELHKRVETLRGMLRTTLDSAPARPTAKAQGKFDALIDRGVITREQLAAAERDARPGQADVETILMARHGVAKADIGVALSQFYSCPFLAPDETSWISPDLLQGLKLAYLRQRCWVPLSRAEGVVTVLVDNPHDLHKIDDIERVLGRRTVRLTVGLRADILALIDSASGAPRQSTSTITTLLQDLTAEALVEAPPPVTVTEASENDSTIIRLANQILLDAHGAGASDIHVEPAVGDGPTAIRFRVDGTCVDYQEIPPAFRNALIARFKIMAQLDIAERRLPQDGKIRLRVTDRDLEVRVATVPTVGGEDLVMRLLRSSATVALDQLGLSARNADVLKGLAQKPYGLILCVGPTGSGKTTTLHGLLAHINTRERKIWTAEDPVEIVQPGLRQVQVRAKIGLTFATALRAFLRGDPDVIMVGEMRDKETASIAVEASLTGHLVLSTLHTNSAAETIIRLLDLELDPFNFSDALLGVLAQRLVKRICEHCSEPYTPSQEELDDLRRYAGPDGDGMRIDADVQLRAGRGCNHCNQTGFRGRQGIHELLVASTDVKRLIQSRARITEIFTQAAAEGMTTLVQDGVRKVLTGTTTLKQVRAAAIR